MKYQKKFIFLFLIIVLSIVSLSAYFYRNFNTQTKKSSKKLNAIVLKQEDGYLTVQEKNQAIYTFLDDQTTLQTGEFIELEYSGVLKKNKTLQEAKIIGYKTLPTSLDESGVPTTFLDNGIFKDFYVLAYHKLKTLTLDEKIAQLLLVRYPNQQEKILSTYPVGGFVFYENDFQDKEEKQVIDMISKAQNASKIPLLTAVDEEGGEVVRVSSNPKLVEEKFKSSKELYQEGGFAKITEDTKKKSEVLSHLLLNVNLAPVVDVSTSPSDYMYKRSLGEDTKTTATYAETVIEASKTTSVSYVLKHFPGYGNNSDTHQGTVEDNRRKEDIMKNDIPPFEAGIEKGAEAILISHNTVKNIDSTNPASLSPTIHNILRNQLNFTGIIMTDDLEMKATSSIDQRAVKAILAGNDIIITTDYEKSFNDIKKAVEENSIDENLIDKLAFRVLAWKYYKGLMFEQHK